MRERAVFLEKILSFFHTLAPPFFNILSKSLKARPSFLTHTIPDHSIYIHRFSLSPSRFFEFLHSDYVVLHACSEDLNFLTYEIAPDAPHNRERGGGGEVPHVGYRYIERNLCVSPIQKNLVLFTYTKAFLTN